MSSTRTWPWVALIAVSWACEERATPLPSPSVSTGERGGPCYGNGTCNAGLDCQADRCVDAAASDASASDLDASAPDLDGGAPSGDTGAPPEETGSVFGVVRLAGEADHRGVVVRIAGRTATTGAAGDYRLDDVPVGSHALEATPPAVAGRGRVLGAVRRGDGAPLRAAVRVALQVAPRTNTPGRTVGVVVFRGRQTEVPALELARPDPVRLYATTDASGGFTLEGVPSGEYAGDYPEQPDVHTGRYLQPTGTFAVVATTRALSEDANPEDPRDRPGNLGYSVHDGAPGLGSDPAVMIDRALTVRADADNRLDPISLYPYAYVLTEDNVVGARGLDLDAPGAVTAASGAAELLLSLAPGSGTLMGVDLDAAHGVQLTAEVRMDAVRTAPIGGFTNVVRLSFDTEQPWWLGRQPAGERVLVARKSDGTTAVKLKALLSGQGGGAGGSFLAVAFLVLPAQNGGFAD